MRRILAIGAALAALTAAVLVAAGCGGGGEQSGYRIDAIFDSAGFLTPGTDVRIGGAKVGQVKDLTLTRDHKARVEMDVDKRFAPFRSDADCTIQPQSLISEKFVNCTPGTPDARPLRKAGDTTILPVANTHPPIDIDLVLNVFDRPVRERLTLLLSALGTGLAARGEDLNETILRAAPALKETRRVLRVLDQDRDQLRQLITDSDTVLASLAAGRGRVADFVRSTGEVAAVSGARRDRVAASIRELPPLLREARSGLGQLTRFAEVGTPFARRLRASAPGLNQLVRQLAPFAERITPTVLRLGQTARRARPALRDIAPQARRLSRFAKNLPQAVGLLDELGISVRDNGVVEGLGNLAYYGATALARFDKHGHILPSYLILSPCAIWSETPSADCDAHFKSSDARMAALRRAQQREAQAKRKPSRKGEKPAPATGTPETRLPLPELPKPKEPVLPRLPDLPKVVNDVLDAVGGVLKPQQGKDGGPPQQGDPVKDLLDFLLK